MSNRNARMHWPILASVALTLASCATKAVVVHVPTAPERLQNDVTRLASTFGERNVTKQPAALNQAAAWIESRFAAIGTARSEPFDCDGTNVRNIYVDLRGNSSPDEIVVVGAHYDTVPGSPGANDNGSGVAAVLELADRFAKKPHAKTIRFIAFVNEEMPYFQSPQMGSLVHADGCKKRGERIIGMLSMETIGCFSDAPNSQRYPAPGMNLILPTVGNFIGVVGDLSHRAFVDRVTTAMKSTSTIPVESASLPATLPGIGWSDHWAFWQDGYDAAMVTDTAPFRYAHYHQKTDTPDKLDYVRMAKVVDATEAAIQVLAATK